MLSLFSKIEGYKTYIVAVVTVIYALVTMWNGTMDQHTGVAMILGALGLGGLRHGITTSTR
jgi:type IV secretory pathway VirB2 component (pilin)